MIFTYTIRLLVTASLLILLMAEIGLGQQEVKWELLAGENNEFAVYMPGGYLTGSQTAYRLIGKNKDDNALISRRATVASLINGTLLTFDICEGDTENVEKIEIEGHPDLKQEGEVTNVEKFRIRTFSGLRKGRIFRVQYFNSGKRLYSLTSIATTENDIISKAFFENGRIQSNKRWLVPNMPKGTTTTRLPRIIAIEPERVDDSHPVELSQVDRPPLLLFIDRNSFSYDNRKEVTGGNIEIKILLSSSGRVTKAEILKSSFLRMNKDAIDRAKGTIFIPAEKDCKLVSVYQVLGNSFGMRY